VSNQQKAAELSKLFLGFPSEKTRDEEQTMLMTAAYLETLSSFSLETVSAACSALRKRSSPFPPSEGMVFAECQKIDAREREQRKWEQSRRPHVRFERVLLQPQKKTFTSEELADWNFLINHASPPYHLRVDANGMPLKIPQGYPGAGQDVVYGYLTPREAEVVKGERQRTGPIPQTKDRRFPDPSDDDRFAGLDAFARETI
jgi:hypothetical protein